MPNWTKDQELAINERGGKIIVSAAAGSGKTAVLSQRVINYILQGGSIDTLLIVTFTNAAAQEMKDRIKDKINNEYKKDLLNNHLREQLQLVDSAMITTMDSFYGNIVRENFEKLDINKNFDILSNQEEKILKNKVIKQVLENSFNKVEDYSLLLDFFGGYTLDNLEKVIYKISYFLDTLPFKEELINKIISRYEQNNDFYKKMFIKQIHDKMNSYNKIYNEIISEMYSESSCFDKTLNILKSDKNYIDNFIECNSFDELSSLMRRIDFERFYAPKDHKEDSVVIKYKIIREEFKNEVNKNLKELSFMTDKLYEEEKNKIIKIIKILFEIIRIYELELFNEKKNLNLFTFGDIAHFVIRLLINNGNKTELAINLSNRFNEILIDEYQDTNNLQNVIFNALSKDNNNLFIVGDVKQSIYRFRSACPEIFNNDKNNSKPDSFPKLITLSKNFRSRRQVLDFCNFIFENTMTESYGEVNYNSDEKLYLGANFEPLDDLDTEVCILDGMQKVESDEENLTNAEKEAIYVADKIKHLLDSKYQIYDNKKCIKKDIKPSDIVILLRSLKNAKYYSLALNKRKISCYLESTSEYFDNYEVELIINLLKIIINPYDDVSLMSVLNSSLIAVSLDDISLLRSKNKKLSLYENLCYGNDKIKLFLSDLNDFRNYSNTHKLYELLSLVYKKYNIIPIISAMKNGLVRQKNLLQMLNHATNFDKKNLSLYEFINYLEEVILSKESLEGVNPLSDGDNVLITTIHKSKGLEYPVVILSETGRKFNFKDLQNNIMINDDLGLALEVKDTKYLLRYKSIWQMIFKEYELNKMLSEELRILYVALTRAKEKIIITGYTNNLEKLITKISSKIGDDKTISNLYLKSVINYMDIILACLLRHPSCKDLRSLSNVIPKTFSNSSNVKVFITPIINISENEFNELNNIKKEEFDINNYNKIKNFKYDYKGELPTYLSVSDIKHNNNYSFTKEPDFMKDGISHTSVGNLYHKVFELLPVRKYSINDLINELDNLIIKGKISKEDKDKIDIYDVFAYLTSDLYDMMVMADKIYKEKKFTFNVPARYYDNSLSGNILVDGIVDLLFIKDNVFTIVDYKTDNVNSSDELIKLYKVQLDLYELALKQTMDAKKVKKYIYSIKLKCFIEV